MTMGSKTAVTAGLVGALGLGIWIGNEMVNRQLVSDKEAPASIAEAAPPAKPAPSPRPRAAVRRAQRVAETVATAERAEERAEEVKVASIEVTSPDLHARLRPVLNRGANLSIAGEGFRDGEQFATLAHAARNTEVPFMLLKHRVLDEGKSLADAIRESKPETNADSEAERARNQARADLAAIASN